VSANVRTEASITSRSGAIMERVPIVLDELVSRAREQRSAKLRELVARAIDERPRLPRRGARRDGARVSQPPAGGARHEGASIVYPVNETALRHGAGVEQEATSGKEAYAGGGWQPGLFREGSLPGYESRSAR
jgi:hypothetical protein